MPVRIILERIRKLISVGDRHYDDIELAFGDGHLKQPHQPMSDRELATAIGEFMAKPRSDEGMRRLGAAFDKSAS